MYLAQGDVEGIALADGAGHLAYSQLGAKQACRAGLEYVLPRFAQLYEGARADTIRCEVVGAVQAELARTAAALGLERDELGSTLLLLCREPQSGRYLCLHIGDGVVGCVHQGRCVTLSSPFNGITMVFTTLTTSPGCMSRCKVFRGERKGAAFFLLSDGATRYLWDGEAFLPAAADQLTRRDWAGLESDLDAQRPEDDYSFIALESQ